MANILGFNTWTIDSEGVLAIRPVCLRKVTIFPNAAADAATFTWWDDNATPDHHLEQKSSDWATATHTSTGNNPAGSPAANDIS